MTLPFQVLRFVWNAARGMLLVTACTAAVSAAFNVGLIAVAHRAITRLDGSPEGSLLSPSILIAFLALGLGKLATGFLAEVVPVRHTQRLSARMRRDLVRRLMQISYRDFETVGPSKMLAALTEDVMTISSSLMLMPGLAVNLAVLGGGGLYLLWLSAPLFGMLAVFVLAGLVVYRFMVRRMDPHFQAARDASDTLFRHYRSLTGGMKELKLNRARREAFLRECVEPATEDLQHHYVKVATRFSLASSVTHFFFFLLIGAVLYFAPRFSPGDTAVLSGYLLTCLYLLGPFTGMLHAVPVFKRATVSFAKIEALGLQLEEIGRDAEADEAPVFDASSITLEDIGFTYHDPHHGEFTLGPVNLQVQRGSVLFITGGNGSGKSTLGKILCGLYPPDRGRILLGDQPVGEAADAYRQLFSVVFTDFHLFEELLGIDESVVAGRAAAGLERLQLHEKVSIEGGRFSTLDLSQGQRKRLALMTAWLEDRPVCMFDEWAADQDPGFKEIFYTELIPELKAEGRTVIVITHDDRYFERADQVVKLADGKIV